MARQIGKARRGIGARWRGTTLILGALLACVIAGVALGGSSDLTSGGSAPTIASDKADYNPGATVTLTGGGWLGATETTPAESVHIVVNDTVGQTWSHDVTVTPDANGNITDVFQLPSYFVSDYDVTATGTVSGTATTTFTDQVAANLDQCQNITLAFLGDPCGTAPANAHPNWANGDVNQSNSQYREGDGLPYRSSITGLTNGTWTIRVEYDFTKGGIPAIDRLTRYNLTQASNPCLSTNDVTCTVGSPKFSFLAPSEVVGPPSAAQPALPNSGDLHTWNGLASVLLSTKGADAKNMFVWNENAACTVTFGGAGQNWTGNLATSFDDGKVLQDGSAAGDSQRQFAFKVAVSGCAQGTDLMMGWSGHIASHLDWGVGKGAGSISGAPFHMRILGVDNAQGTSGGNQDRSVQLSAIVQTLEVRKVLSPVGSGTFDLQIDNATKAAAVGNGGTTGPVAVAAGSHSVGELGAGGTNLASFSSSISCVDSSGNPVKSGSGTSLTGVNVPTGDSVVCTITNTLLQSNLKLVKNVTNNDGGTKTAADWKLTAGAAAPNDGRNFDSQTATPVFHNVFGGAQYTLSEDPNAGAGYSTTGVWSCDGGTFVAPNKITVSHGTDVTCSITNTDDTPTLKLVKNVKNNDGGTEDGRRLEAVGGGRGSQRRAQLRHRRGDAGLPRRARRYRVHAEREPERGRRLQHDRCRGSVTAARSSPRTRSRCRWAAR